MPGSPAITIVCASPAAERSRSPPMTPSSSARPTTPARARLRRPRHQSGTASDGNQGFRARISGGASDSAPPVHPSMEPSDRSTEGRHHEHRTHARHLSRHRRPGADAGRLQPDRRGWRETGHDRREQRFANTEVCNAAPWIRERAPAGVCDDQPVVDDNMSLRRPHEERLRCGIDDPRAAAGDPGRGRAQNGSSGSIPIARKSSERYTIEPWNTRIGETCSCRMARLYRRWVS